MITKHRQKFFYGWVIVAVGALLSAASTGVLSFFAALFVTPVSEALGVSRATFSAYSSFATVTTMCVMPFVGTLFRRYPMRRLLALGGLLGAAALGLYSAAQSVYVFYFAAVLSGLAVCLFGAIPIVILISNWFNSRRGLATGIAFTGSGLVSTLFSPLISRVIAAYGWRVGYRVLIAALVVIVAATLLLVREKPADMGLAPLGAAEGPDAPQKASGFTRAQALRTKSLWVFLLAIFLTATVSMGTQHQLVSYWTDCGNTPAFAASMYSLTMGVGLIAKALMGSVYDRFGVRRATVCICLIACSALLTLAFFTSGKAVALPAVLFGLTTSIQIVLPTYLTNRYFGDREYSSIYGIVTTVFYCGVSVGVPVCAFVYDRFASYRPAWLLFAALTAVTLGLLLAADRLSKHEFRTILHIEREGQV